MSRTTVSGRNRLLPYVKQNDDQQEALDGPFDASSRTATLSHICQLYILFYKVILQIHVLY